MVLIFGALCAKPQVVLCSGLVLIFLGRGLTYHTDLFLFLLCLCCIGTPRYGGPTPSFCPWSASLGIHVCAPWCCTFVLFGFQERRKKEEERKQEERKKREEEEERRRKEAEEKKKKNEERRRKEEEERKLKEEEERKRKEVCACTEQSELCAAPAESADLGPTRKAQDPCCQRRMRIRWIGFWSILTRSDQDMAILDARPTTVGRKFFDPKTRFRLEIQSVEHK